nr:cyclase family protein [Sulfobacillus harzensis]
MLLYPGIPQPRIHDFATPAVDGYGMSEFCFWNHLGTHIDAPTHFYAEGWTLDQFPIERFVTTVRTVDCQNVDDITAQHLMRQLAHLAPGEGVLLLTGQYRHWGTPRYFGPFAVLTEDGAEWLLKKKVGMVLVDAPSPPRWLEIR